MASIGYKLFTEAHSSVELVKNARLAEDAGFDYVNISDHFHPWTSGEKRSPFAWSVIGGISQVTDRVQVSTGVTCPTMRYHPALVAQMAATAAVMLGGRFQLAVGTGENLNEHVVGDCFPSSALVRREMLAEAIEIIRGLWTGSNLDYLGDYYRVERAQLFELPETPPPILMAAEGPEAAMMAGEAADGLVHIPEENPEEIISAFRSSGGEGKPAMFELTVCYEPDQEEGKRIAHEWFPIAANKGELNWILPSPSNFEALQKMTKPDDVAEKVLIGTDLQRYVAKIDETIGMGFDHVTIHQVGPHQEEFIGFAKEQLLPELQKAGVQSPAGMAAAGSR